MKKILYLVGLVLFLNGCAGGGGSGPSAPSGGGGSGPSAPSGLTYMSPVTAIVGQATTLGATVSGTVTSYSVSPSLPAGLALDSSGGIISGTPTAVMAQATYAITASNGGGGTTFALVLTVNPAAPSGLSAAPTALTYGTPAPLLVGIAVSLSPTVTGTVSSYAVSPALPAGLALDAATGIISGTPTTVTAQATYTITASDISGHTSVGLVLTVNPPPTAAAQTVTQLPPPPGYPAASGLQYVCGGQFMDIAVYKFDVNDNIDGTIRTWTSCSTGGRGENPHVYEVFTDVVWDNRGNYLTVLPYSGIKPVVTGPLILSDCQGVFYPYSPALYYCPSLRQIAADGLGHEIAMGAGASWVVGR